ncbi:hypothetical protein PAECIP112173_02340 [Paenibacillus sp. JJ-100]|nr:hypothetical protein PAECIP112173_02340 [Paenibacillus sp. JJ-100]
MCPPPGRQACGGYLFILESLHYKIHSIQLRNPLRSSRLLIPADNRIPTIVLYGLFPNLPLTPTFVILAVTITLLRSSNGLL